LVLGELVMVIEALMVVMEFLQYLDQDQLQQLVEEVAAEDLLDH